MTLVCDSKLNFKDNYILRVIKKGRQFYHGWFCNNKEYKFPLTIAITDVTNNHGIGDYISVPKKEFIIKDPVNPMNRAGWLHYFRLFNKEKWASGHYPNNPL